MTADVWSALESELTAAAGLLQRRVLPHSRHDVFLRVQSPGHLRSVVMVLRGSAGHAWKTLRSSRGLEISIDVRGTSEAEVVLAEADSRFRDIFTAIVNDVLRVVERDESASPLDAVTARLRRWQTCLETAGKGLSAERQAGLYAELLILQDICVAHLGPTSACAAWFGPAQALQDFQWASAALEVKSSRTAEPQHMTITSERQLDTTAVERLWVAHVALDARAEGAGETLPDRVNRVRDELATAPEDDLITFNDSLMQAGYLDQDARRYEDTHYSLRDLAFFSVAEGFPRITEADLMEGIGAVSYKLALAACEPYRLAEDGFVASLKTVLEDPVDA